MRPWGLYLRMGGVAVALGAVYLLCFPLAYLGVVELADGPVAVAPWLAALVVTAGTALGLLVQYRLGKRAALASVEAVAVTPERAPRLDRATRTLCRELRIEVPRVAVADLGGPNAFAVGRRGDGVVVLDRELFELLDWPELRGVLAHELAHLKHRDSVVMTFVTGLRRVVVALATAVALAAVTAAALFVEALEINDSGGTTDVAWDRITVVAVGVVAAATSNVLLVLSMALSRYREFAADATAAEATGDHRSLARALVKIERAHERGAETPARPLSALCTFGSAEGLLSDLFASHPTTDARIAMLWRRFEE